MNIELLVLGGYGQFVWPAFIFTFVSCFVLYIRTKKELKRHEKMFLIEFNKIQIATLAKEKLRNIKDKIKKEEEISI